jgi:hypothetical protein
MWEKIAEKAAEQAAKAVVGALVCGAIGFIIAGPPGGAAGLKLGAGCGGGA